jgi:hypothetical protein
MIEESSPLWKRLKSIHHGAWIAINEADHVDRKSTYHQSRHQLSCKEEPALSGSGGEDAWCDTMVWHLWAAHSEAQGRRRSEQGEWTFPKTGTLLFDMMDSLKKDCWKNFCFCEGPGVML